jgi:hypothetical protein
MALAPAGTATWSFSVVLHPCSRVRPAHVLKGISAGLVDGLAAGIGVGSKGFPGGIFSWRRMIPSRIELRIRSHFRHVMRRLWLGMLIGFGLGALVGLPVALIYRLVYGVIVMLALGPAVGLALSLRRLFDASSDVSAASPASTLHDDTMSAILQAPMGLHRSWRGCWHRFVRDDQIRRSYRYRDRCGL